MPLGLTIITELVPLRLPEVQAVKGGEIRRLPSWQKNSGRISGGLFGEMFCELNRRRLRVGMPR